MTLHLDYAQLARLEALEAVAPLVKKSGGPFSPTNPASIPELVDLADYVLTGVHPMERTFT